MNSKRNRFIFYVATVAFYTYVPVLAPYVEHTGGSLFFVGFVLGSYGLTQMLLRVPLGIWSDRIGKRKVFILLGMGMGCAALSSLGFSLGMFGGPLLAGGIGDAFGLTEGFLCTGMLSLVGAVLASRWIASPALYQEAAKKQAT